MFNVVLWLVVICCPKLGWFWGLQSDDHILKDRQQNQQINIIGLTSVRAHTEIHQNQKEAITKIKSTFSNVMALGSISETIPLGRSINIQLKTQRLQNDTFTRSIN